MASCLNQVNILPEGVMIGFPEAKTKSNIQARIKCAPGSAICDVGFISKRCSNAAVSFLPAETEHEEYIDSLSLLLMMSVSGWQPKQLMMHLS